MQTTIKIMMADDDADDRFFFKKMLDQLDLSYQFQTASDGAELLTILPKMKALPDILFLDINMPKVNGMECLVKLSKNSKYKNMPIVMYSTASTSEVSDRAYELGAYHYIRKGNFEETLQILEKLMATVQQHVLVKPDVKHFELHA